MYTLFSTKDQSYLYTLFLPLILSITLALSLPLLYYLLSISLLKKKKKLHHLSLLSLCEKALFQYCINTPLAVAHNISTWNSKSIVQSLWVSVKSQGMCQWGSKWAPLAFLHRKVIGAFALDHKDTLMGPLRAISIKGRWGIIKCK